MTSDSAILLDPDTSGSSQMEEILRLPSGGGGNDTSLWEEGG